MKTDKNKELMLACGSKTGRYDIEAPDQWRWILMNSPDLIERTMAWVKSKTTAYLHESPHCVDEHGKALYIPHLAADLECKEQTARNALGTLQSQGRIKFEKKRIWYCADIPQARAEIENSENAGRTKGEKKLPVQSYFFPYIVDFIKELPEKKRVAAETTLNKYLDWRREFLADGMASLRVIADKVEDTTLLEIGVPKKRLTKRRPEESKWVQLELLQEPDFVQSYEFGLHKPEKEFVDARAFRTAATSATPKSAHAPVPPAASPALPINTRTPPPPPPLSSPGARKAEEEDTPTLYQIFKAEYPKGHFDEPNAKPSFEKRTKAEQRRIIERLHVYLECDRWQDEGGRWVPLASTWLKSYEADPPPLLKKTSRKSAASETFEQAFAAVGED